MFNDLSVNESVISKAVILVYRYGNYVHTKLKVKPLRKILNSFYKLFDLIVVKIIAGADVPATCTIGKSIYFPHGGKGVVIHPNAIIGDNVKIYHQVTIGSGGMGNNNAPKIGNNVMIGTGAKVLGDITIGSNSKIGANAVLLSSIPDNSTAIGIPAMVIPKKELKNAN